MKKLLFFSLTTSLLVLSCSKNNTILDNGETSLRVNASVAGSNPTKSIIYQTAFPAGSAIGVELLSYVDNSAYSPKTNVEFTTDGLGNWSSTESYTLSPTKAKVYGYFPFVTLTDNTLPFYNIPISIESDINHNSDIDYMYATPMETALDAASNSNHIINLQMNHALTQISFIVYKENYTGSGNLTSFVIEDALAGTGFILVNNTPADFNMDIRDGSITGGVEGIIRRNLPVPIVLEVATVTPLFPATDVNDLKSQVLSKGCSALIVPPGQIAAGDVKFSFTIDGTNYSINNSSPILWEKGKQYIYKIKLSGTSLNISSVTIAQWQAVLGDDMVIQ